MLPHKDHLLPLACPWCDAPFTYSWWHGGTTCKKCSKQTGKARLEEGNVSESIYGEKGAFPNCYHNGPAVDGFIPYFRHTGWMFRCNVSSGQLISFLKWGAMLTNYNPMTVTSMETLKKRTRWHWVVSIKVPLGKRPEEMDGVEWYNEMTVRPQ
jgi:hypothetical protein